MQPWYIAQVAPGREKIVRDHIVRRGFEALAPTWARTCRRSGGRRERYVVNRAWLPRYVFVRGGHGLWELIDRMATVHGILAPHGYPLKIPQSAVDWFLANHGRLFDEETGQRRPITVGDLVRVASGPCCGKQVRVAAVAGKTASVPMEFMGAVRIVKFPLDQLEVA